MWAFCKLSHLPANAHAAFVIVVSKHGCPRDRVGLHAFAEHRLHLAKVVKFAVDVVARQNDEVGLRACDQLLDVGEAADVHIGNALLKICALDLSVARRVARAIQADDLHIGKLQNAERCVRIKDGFRRGAIYFCNHGRDSCMG